MKSLSVLLRLQMEYSVQFGASQFKKDTKKLKIEQRSTDVVRDLEHRLYWKGSLNVEQCGDQGAT